MEDLQLKRRELEKKLEDTSKVTKLSKAKEPSLPDLLEFSGNVKSNQKKIETARKKARDNEQACANLKKIDFEILECLKSYIPFDKNKKQRPEHYRLREVLDITY